MEQLVRAGVYTIFIWVDLGACIVTLTPEDTLGPCGFRFEVTNQGLLVAAIAVGLTISQGLT